MEFGLLVLLMSISSYSMMAKSLSSSIITAPMFFIAVGFGVHYFSLVEIEDSEHLLHLIAEIALVTLLFLDASQINLRRLKKQNAWPLRMLLIGLPLSIILGTLVGYLFFPDWPWAMIALVAAILAPTDAALGQAVVSNKLVPKNERQSLTVESGLNDGLALPIILFLASFLMAASPSQTDQYYWLWYALKQVGLGITAGIAIGWSSGHMFIFSEERKLSSNAYEGIGVLTLIGTAYLAADLLGGNGFISAFVAGLTFGNKVKGHCRFIYQFAESGGQMLIWAAFIVIGIGLLPSAIEQLSLPIVGYITASLFVVRPVAIYISLLGTKSKAITRLFMGWFGPRGLATALFALIVSKQILDEYSSAILVVAINAVLLSTILHGVTAGPAAKWYGLHVLKRKRNNRSIKY